MQRREGHLRPSVGALGWGASPEVTNDMLSLPQLACLELTGPFGDEARPDRAQKVPISSRSQFRSLEQDFLHPDIHVVLAFRKTKKTNCL